MKKLLIISALAIASASCQKDYSLEYFKQYQLDSQNKVMAKCNHFYKPLYVGFEKVGYDLFKVQVVYYDKANHNYTAYGLFNHNGKLIDFTQK